MIGRVNFDTATIALECWWYGGYTGEYR